MPPAHTSLLSPPHLAYLHASLSLRPPIRPDARTPTSFRPLLAETDLLPAANGSARICFADGTEAIVSVRADVERTVGSGGELAGVGRVAGGGTGIVGMREGDEKEGRKGGGEDSWVEVTVEVAGQQQQQQQRGGGGGGGGGGETAMGFLEQVLWEGLVGDDGGGGGLRERLRLGERWHWRLFVDVRDTCFPFFLVLFRLSHEHHEASACICVGISHSHYGPHTHRCVFGLIASTPPS